MPSVHGTGLSHTGEGYLLRGPNAAFWKARRPVPVILYGHGAGGVAKDVVTSVLDMELIRKLSRKYLVLLSDWGGPSTFGNSTCNHRFKEACEKLAANFNVDPAAPVGLIGTSQGGIQGLNFTRAFPEKSAFVAGLIPLVDLQDLYINNRVNLQQAVKDAYGGTYDDSSMGLQYNPVKYADLLPASLPIHLYATENDVACPKETSLAFKTKRPQTEVTVYDIGPIGHAPPIYTAAMSSAVEFCMDNAPF